jgi:hypothetical protein
VGLERTDRGVSGRVHSSRLARKMTGGTFRPGSDFAA